MRQENLEAIVYIARKLHWSREEIGKLTPAQLRLYLEELQYQESVDNYRQQYAIAAILAAIYNTIPKKSGIPLKPKNFLSGEEPTRIKEVKKEVKLEDLAKEKGIRLPKEE